MSNEIARKEKEKFYRKQRPKPQKKLEEARKHKKQAIFKW